MLLLVVVAATVTGRLVDAPDVIDTARQAIREVGPWASVVFAAVYVVATLLGFPGTPLTLACALMFGFWKAFMIMVTATTLASSIAFLVARYVARDSIERWLGDDSRLVTPQPSFDRFRCPPTAQVRVDIETVEGLPFASAFPVFLVLRQTLTIRHVSQ